MRHLALPQTALFRLLYPLASEFQAMWSLVLMVSKVDYVILLLGTRCSETYWWRRLSCHYPYSNHAWWSWFEAFRRITRDDKVDGSRETFNGILYRAFNLFHPSNHSFVTNFLYFPSYSTQRKNTTSLCSPPTTALSNPGPPKAEETKCAPISPILNLALESYYDFPIRR